MSDQMVRIPLPDGRFAELPAGMTPQQMAEALNSLPPADTGSALKKSAVSLMTGVGETVGGVLQAPGAIGRFLAKNKPSDGGLIDRAFPDPKTPGPVESFGQDVSKAWGDLEKEQGMDPGVPRTFVKGVGGALATPFPGGATTKPLQTVFANLMSGGVGNVSADFAEKLAPEGLKGPASFLGGLAGGGGTAIALGPRLSLAEMDINQAFQGQPKGSFAEAADLMTDFERSGAKTYTSAEAFPDNAALQTLASQARNYDTRGFNALRGRTEGRKQDLIDLTNRTVGLIDPTLPDPATVSGKVAGAAERKLAGLEKARGDAYGNTIAAAPDVDPRVMALLEQHFLSLAKNPDIIGAKQDAYRKFAESLKRSDGGLHTNLRNLTDVNKLAKESIPSDTAPAQSALYRDVYTEANDFLKGVSPDYRKAEEAFAQTSRNVVDPARASVLGRLASPNYRPDRPVATGRLTPVDEITDPALLRGVLSDLQANAQNTPNIAREIASALAQRKTRDGVTNAQTALAGEKGAPRNRTFSTMLDAAGAPRQQIEGNLRVSDALQGNMSPVQLKGLPDPLLRQMIRPFRTIDMAVTATGEATMQRQIAEILAQQGQPALKRLQEIAMFNPDVRRALTALAAARGGAGLTGE